jgi:extracellular factor (EF) 3-hydroxypalmitic acid methyl ester biosynthesis protein
MKISSSDNHDRVRTFAEKLTAQLAEFDQRIKAVDDACGLYPKLAQTLDDCLGSLADLQLWGPENRLLSSELWNAAGSWLCRGWLQNHARTKPRGYAGDHEMLARIYEHALCDDPLGRLFDQYFQAQAAPQAVRNRMRMITHWISETIDSQANTKIAIVGSAFGLELRDALSQMPESERRTVQATLLDLDPAALDFALERLQPLLGRHQLTLTNANLFRLPDRPRLTAELTGATLLLCPGLFDYLDDAAASNMIRCLYGQLAPGGRLIIFQFAPQNPSRAYMEWFGNWYLIYRDSAAFQMLIEQADLTDALIEFGAEPLGIDLYVQITRNV